MIAHVNLRACSYVYLNLPLISYIEISFEDSCRDNTPFYTYSYLLLFPFYTHYIYSSSNRQIHCDEGYG